MVKLQRERKLDEHATVSMICFDLKILNVYSIGHDFENIVFT